MEESLVEDSLVRREAVRGMPGGDREAGGIEIG